MIIWGKNRTTYPLFNVLPLKKVKAKSGKLSFCPLTWHRDWGGWQLGRLQNNQIDRWLIKLERKNEN
ncbi:hypothetical protein IJJ27_04355 [bacterium]|nr:hypothetical protein [bacterium]